jgi:hypothetical protein
MRISQAADITAIGGQTILQLSVEEYLNLHLANKKIADGMQEASKGIKKIRR